MLIFIILIVFMNSLLQDLKQEFRMYHKYLCIFFSKEVNPHEHMQEKVTPPLPHANEATEGSMFAITGSGRLEKSSNEHSNVLSVAIMIQCSMTWTWLPSFSALPEMGPLDRVENTLLTFTLS